MNFNKLQKLTPTTIHLNRKAYIHPQKDYKHYNDKKPKHVVVASFKALDRQMIHNEEKYQSRLLRPPKLLLRCSAHYSYFNAEYDRIFCWMHINNSSFFLNIRVAAINFKTHIQNPYQITPQQQQ
ncbi:unnamed protein product [Prunus brigantina]